MPRRLNGRDKQSSGVGEIMSKYLSAIVRRLSRITFPVTHCMASAAQPRLAHAKCVDTRHAFAERREAPWR